MINIKYEEFIGLVTTQKFSFARIFNMSGEQFARYPVDKEKGDTSGLINFFEGIKNQFGGHWKIVCRHFSTSKAESECTYCVLFKEAKEIDTSKPVVYGADVDIEKVKKEEREKIEQELKIKELQLREKELKQSVKNLEEPMGKVATIFNMWLDKISNGTFKMKRDPVLSGGGDGSNLIPDKETRPDRNGDVRPDNKKELDQALENFRNSGVSDKFLLKLSEKVIQQPQLIDSVKTLLNINC
jgi:hypothetical protein